MGMFRPTFRQTRGSGKWDDFAELCRVVDTDMEKIEEVLY
jgi:hypothetical protein